MKKLVLLLVLIALLGGETMLAAKTEAGDQQNTSSTAAPPTPSANRSSPKVQAALVVATQGEPYGLRIENDALTFCDNRGGRRLNLETGVEVASTDSCPKDDEANTACSGLSIDASVRASMSEPNDTVDLDGWSVPLEGRVHDCAAEGNTLAVVTASAVVLIDVEKEATHEIGRSGGERVAVSSKWIVWSTGTLLHTVSRD